MTVNSTARWPQRLEHVATLLRAEGAAVLSPSGGSIRTLFAHRLDEVSEWRELLGADVIERATAADDPLTTALAAGRWGDAAFAVLARIATPEGPALLCALRHHVPFDRVEIDGARAAADLLGMILADGRTIARRDLPADPLGSADAMALLAPDERTHGMARGLRVLAVEDHPLMRLGVRTLFEREGILLAGMTATCAEAAAIVRHDRPDAILLDLSLPDASGVEAIARLREATTAPIVVFSVERSADLVRAALRAGAVGFVAKDAPPPRVGAALAAAVAGLTALGPGEAVALTRGAVDDEPAEPVPAAPQARPAGDPPREPLTARELDLLRYLAEGYTNKEIARAMVLAEDTVKKAVQLLIAKLGATDRTHAVVLALRQHLID